MKKKLTALPPLHALGVWNYPKCTEGASLERLTKDNKARRVLGFLGSHTLFELVNIQASHHMIKASRIDWLIWLFHQV